MRILGIHYETHDSGAALVVDGQLVAACNEERFSRTKMDDAPPVASIRACLDLGGIAPADLDIVAWSGRSFPGNWGGYSRYDRIRSRAILGPFWWLRRSPYRWGGFRTLKHMRRRQRQARTALEGFQGRERHFPHEYMHLTGAYATGGIPEALVLACEGSGWDHTATVATGRVGRGIEELARTPWPHSPGSFYELATTLLGFHPIRHAGKTTGLAALGDPSRLAALVDPLLVVEGLRFRLAPTVLRWQHERRRLGKTPTPFQGAAPEDIAAAFQNRLEEVVLTWIRNAIEATGLDRLVLAGGTFANVKLNQRILEQTPATEIFVHPGMSDVGIAVGAAFAAHLDEQPAYEPHVLTHVFLGPEYSEGEMQRALEAAEVPFERPAGGIHDAVAAALEQRRMVARVVGRMEYGPRALGHRSVLADATRRDIHDALNERLERTEFMPFAPAVLSEQAEAYMVLPEGARRTAAFMTISCPVTERAEREIPAAVHVDGTARPQIVSPHGAADFHAILSAYERRTGVGALINTSFNMHEEPIVCTPTEAVRAFLSARLEHLALGPFFATRPDLHAAASQKPDAAV